MESESNILGLRMKYLKMAADETAIRFLSPVYLVGSYIKNPEKAKDIDIYMVTTKARFFRLFGPDDSGDQMDRIFRFRKKQKLYFENYITDKDIDFKITTTEHFFKNKEDKLKLDNIMEYAE